jgi:hypothetical protein
MSTTLPSPVHHPNKPAGGTTHTGGETVTIVLPLRELYVALIVAVPAAAVLTNPEADTVATEVAEEDQVPELVRFCVLPSLYCPVATSCWNAPRERDGFVGLSVIEVRAGGATVTAVDPLTDP